MKLYYGEIDVVYDFLLNELELSGKQNRMRMKFLKILSEKFQEFRQFYIQLVKENCRVDDEGNLKTKKVNGQEVYDIIDEQKFQREYEELVREEVVIEENEENKEMLLTIRDAVLNCPVPYKGKKAIIYDRICEIFENIYGGDKNEG